MTTRMTPDTDYSLIPSLTMDEARAAAHRLCAMTGAGRPVDDATLLDIERFYRREARLLDEERYDEWYTLLADDLFYWMPMQESRFRRDDRLVIDPDNMAFFDESKVDIAVRLGRINSNLVWTEDPPTRHVYSVTNVEAFETETDGEFETHHVFQQYRHRAEHDDATLCGRRRDLIRRVAGGYQIVNRMILVPQSVLGTKNLTVFF